jgi:hypothetical protein
LADGLPELFSEERKWSLNTLGINYDDDDVDNCMDLLLETLIDS